MVTPKGIKAWLRATNRTYEEYAELIGSTKSTVSQWLREKNPNPMPRVAVRATEYLMRLEKPQDGLSDEELRQMKELARIEGKSLMEFVVDLVRDYLRRSSRKDEGTYLLREDSPPYDAEGRSKRKESS